MDLLAQEATIYSDGGGKAAAGTRPVAGRKWWHALFWVDYEALRTRIMVGR